MGGSAADGKPRDYEVNDNADAWDAHMEDNLLRQVESAIQSAEDDPNWIPHSSWGIGKGALKRVIKQKLHPQPDPWNQPPGYPGVPSPAGPPTLSDRPRIRSSPERDPDCSSP